jgi:hypothetical protein
MKRFLKSNIFAILVAGAALAALLNVPIVGGQSFTELVGTIYLREASQQIRVVGTPSVRNQAGTAAGAWAAARPSIVTDAATRTLTVGECGAVIVATKGSATQTFTLPAATNAGCQFTFIAGHADGEILIDAAADAQGFVYTHFAAVGADADTAIVTEADGAPGIKNTAATNAIGDSLTLVADGTVTWLGVGIASGIWAAQ